MSSQNAIEFFQMEMRLHVNSKAAAEASFEKDREAFGLLYALGWAEDRAIVLAEALHWEAVQRLYDQTGDAADWRDAQAAIDAVQVFMDEATKALLDLRESPRSTSQ